MTQDQWVRGQEVMAGRWGSWAGCNVRVDGVHGQDATPGRWGSWAGCNTGSMGFMGRIQHRVDGVHGLDTARFGTDWLTPDSINCV